MNLKQLKTLIQETVRDEKTKSRKSTRSYRWNKLVETTALKVLLEAEEDELPPEEAEEGQEELAADPEPEASSGGSYNDETNTGGAEATQLIEDMFENIPAFRASMDAMGTSWGLGDVSDDESLARARDDIFGDKATALDRLTDLNQKLIFDFINFAQKT